MVKRKTVGKRMRAKLLDIKQQLRNRTHDPVAHTATWLRSVVQGYFNDRRFCMPSQFAGPGV